MSYNSGVIELVISNRPRATSSTDLKLLARLLPDSYSTQSNDYYLKWLIWTSNELFKVVKSVKTAANCIKIKGTFDFDRELIFSDYKSIEGRGQNKIVYPFYKYIYYTYYL